MITPEQKQARKNFIGASDAAAAIGINPYKTPLDVYLEKTGQTEPFNGNEYTYWGNVLEPIVANRLSEETGLKLRKHGMTIKSKAYPYMGCHLDYKVTGQPIVIEIKTGGFFIHKQWGVSGTDEIPDNVLIQVHHQMICTGFKKGLVAVLLGGQEFRHYSIEFDDSLAQIIIEKEQAFWHYVTTKTPPPPSTLSDINQLYPHDTGQSIEAPESIVQLVENLKAAKFKNNEAAAEVEVIEVQLKNFMGTNSVLTDSAGKVLGTWKNQTTNRLDIAELKKELPDITKQFSKATTNRVMRLRS